MTTFLGAEALAQISFSLTAVLLFVHGIPLLLISGTTKQQIGMASFAIALRVLAVCLLYHAARVPKRPSPANEEEGDRHLRLVIASFMWHVGATSIISFFIGILDAIGFAGYQYSTAYGIVWRSSLMFFLLFASLVCEWCPIRLTALLAEGLRLEGGISIRISDDGGIQSKDEWHSPSWGFRVRRLRLKEITTEQSR